MPHKRRLIASNIYGAGPIGSSMAIPFRTQHCMVHVPYWYGNEVKALLGLLREVKTLQKEAQTAPDFGAWIAGDTFEQVAFIIDKRLRGAKWRDSLRRKVIH